MVQPNSLRRAPAALALLLSFAASCTSHRGKEQLAVADGGKPESERPALTAKDLNPILSPQGNPGKIPDHINVELAVPLVGDDVQFPHAAAGALFTVQPKVDGLLAFTSPSTLAFTPTHGFAPGQHYKAQLEKIPTPSGTLSAPGWSVEFDTPKFAFERFDLDSIDIDKKELTVEMVFTGPPDEAKVRALASFAIDGTAVSPSHVKFSEIHGADAVQAVIDSKELTATGTVTMKLRAGVRLKGQKAEAAAASGSIDFTAGKAIEIKNSHRDEAMNGHFIEVVCSDQAEGGERYYWDNEGEESYTISRRCLPRDEDAQARIHFTPAVKFSVVPGRYGFRIVGDFKRGTYAMKIDAGLRSQAGGMLLGAYERSFSFPARSPQLSLTAQGRYLPRAAWKSLPISHVNVDEVKLEVRQVPPEDLIFWASDDEDEKASPRDSNLILQKTLPLGHAAPDVKATSWVDLSAMLPKTTLGLLEIRLMAKGVRNDAVARIVLTDLNLVAKRADAEQPRNQSVLVWGLDAASGESLSNVTVKAVRKSGKVVATCDTRGDDGCLLSPKFEDDDPEPAFALIATKGDDLTYLKFQDLKTGIDEAEVGGAAYRGAQPYRASVYADRGVFRPGDTAHLVAVLRDRASVAPKDALPVVLQLADPKERTIKKIVAKTNPAGVVSFDWQIPAFADTGSYAVTAQVADQAVGSLSFHVEEFVPERMKVTATPITKDLGTGDAAKVEVAAKYLFGATPVGAKVELSCRIEPTTFKPKENGNLTYGVWHQNGKVPKSINLGTADGTLDKNGTAALTCPGEGGLEEPARVVATAAVFEAGSGRTSQAQAIVPLHPEKFYIGLTSGAEKGTAGKAIPVSGMVVDWNGVPTSAVSSVELRLVRLEEDYGWSFDEEEGGQDYQRYLRPITETKITVPVHDGKFSGSLTPQEDGEGFLVEARAGKARSDLELKGSGFWWWWEPGESRKEQTPKPQKPSWIALDAPAKIEVGQKVQVKAKLPYRGHALFTVETDHVIFSSWRKVEAGENVFDLDVSEFAPNVYASVFVVKDPHLESDKAYLPDRAFGVKSITVEPTDYTQKVTLEVPKEVRSEGKLEVSLDFGKLDGPTWATVAAVDEGILQLTHYQPPEPLQQIFARRALGVETFETIGWSLLLPPSQGNGAGGDSAGGKNGRVQQVKPVALWSGLIQVPADGKAKVSFELPSYRGALKVMAVTVGAKRIGHADAEVIVRDPLVVQTTLPRFLYQGDVAQIPVMISNMSGAPRDIDVSLEVKDLPYPGLDRPESMAPPLSIVGRSQKKLSLAAGKDGVVVFQARTVAAVGAATLRVTASAGDLVSHDQTDVPILPAGVRSHVVGKMQLTNGDNDLTKQLQGWVPTSERSSFWVTSNPYGDVLENASYLIHYPYGCVEQTVSSTRPLLVIGELVPNIDPALIARTHIEDLVGHGLDHLFTMQTPSGGFSLWPGKSEVYQWGTANAVHMLLDAQKLGFSVPQDRLDAAVKYMKDEVDNVASGAKSHGNPWTELGHGDPEPYMQYVLALAGKGNNARLQKLIDGLPPNPTGEQAEMLYMLQAGLYLGGDRRYEKQLRHPDVSALDDERWNRWNLYSDRRRRGFMLATFADLFGQDPAGEALADVVAAGLRGHPDDWYTTQELMWGMTGLGKWLHTTPASFSPPEMIAEGRKIAPRPQPAGAKGSDRVFALQRASEYKTLDLKVKDKSAGALYVMISSDGVREKQDAQEGGAGLAVNRRYLTQDGSPVDFDKHALGDLVFVQIDVTNQTSERIDNIALIDHFPAGWEVENARLGRGGLSQDWIPADKIWQTDDFDIRDDHVEYFGMLEGKQTRSVVYLLRAVSAGHFDVPPVEASAMYDPRLWARSGGRIIDIRGPWSPYLN